LKLKIPNQSRLPESIPEQEPETFEFCAQVVRSVFINDMMIPVEPVLPSFSAQIPAIPTTPSTSTTIAAKPTAYSPQPIPAMPKLIHETPLQMYQVQRWLRRGIESPRAILSTEEREEWKNFVADMKKKYNKHR